MTRRQVLALLALAPLIAPGKRRIITSSSRWSTKCGAPPVEPNGPQHICMSYPSILMNGKEYWIRGFASAPEKAHQGCYIFLYGTQNDFTPGRAHEPQLYAPFFTREMANEGYCAVQVDYARNLISQFPLVAGHVRMKAGDIFGSHGSSALSLLNRIPGCDCSRRTVVHGHSQGGMLASLAGLYTPWVEKILLFSGGCHAGILNVCPEVKRDRQLGWPLGGDASSDSRPQIRVVGIQSDGVLGCGPVVDASASSVSQYQTMTGKKCCVSTGCTGPMCTNCLDSNGTGYYVITKQNIPPHKDIPHNWFLEPVPLSEEDESLTIWSSTYDVDKILNGDVGIGYNNALKVNDVVRNSNKEYGWRASKQYLTS